MVTGVQTCALPICILGKWRKEAEEEREPASRRLHLHFYAKPLEVVGEDGKVAAFRYERTRPDGQGGVEGTGEIRELPIQAIYRAVGYFGSPLEGIPFDEHRGVIPNVEGRVQQEDETSPGQFNEQLPGV